MRVDNLLSLRIVSSLGRLVTSGGLCEKWSLQPLRRAETQGWGVPHGKRDRLPDADAVPQTENASLTAIRPSGAENTGLSSIAAIACRQLEFHHTRDFH